MTLIVANRISEFALIREIRVKAFWCVSRFQSDTGGGVGAGVLKPIAAKERREHKEGKFSLRSLCSLVADQLSKAFVGLLISSREPREIHEREKRNFFDANDANCREWEI